MTGLRIDRRQLLRGAGAVGAAGLAFQGHKAAAKPNVVVVLIDDLARRELGCYGNTFNETPHMDRLAADGIRFTNGYTAAPVCSPTRASIMTGQWPARTGITEYLGPDGDNFLPASHTTLPETLRGAGYRTGLIGKWHLTETYTGDVRTRPGNPWSHGFDEVIASEQKYIAGGDYWWPYFMLPDLPQRKPDEYLVDRLNLEAVDFISRAHQAGTPFFLYLAHYATHVTLDAPQALIDKYAAKPGGTNPKLAAMLEVIDDGVGAIRAKLTELGIAGNTVILLLSDNGGDSGVATSTPLRGAKATLYEGGVRVPMIAYHPQGAGGRVVDTPFSTVDFMPTILDTAGVARPPAQQLDGASFAGLLTGGAAPARDSLFWFYPHWHNPGAPTASVRRGRYKLLRYLHDGRTELFDLVADPGETTDLAAQQPAQVQSLNAALDAHLRDVDLIPPAPTPANFPGLVLEEEFSGGLGSWSILSPAPENRPGSVQASNGLLTVSAGGSPAFALFRSTTPVTDSPAAVILTQRSHPTSGALFAGLVQDAQNYLLAVYNHKLRRAGYDVRVNGVLMTQRITQLDQKISYPGPNARLACVLHRDELTGYAIAAGGTWQYLFTVDFGRWLPPSALSQFRYGFGTRVDGGNVTLERFAVRRR
ncbi:sulfatase [Actinoplanes bogorensis]|uniref:Sulfatase n=1 Tax=Paractinoplanes bogorensis TaxID=1610840 RepID=A0ABS5YRZ3_9ACTN|nr:sulfatase [Actinoplanes bogorensis]MBU2666207.1 sulfatase [Actinoplanes bogorensis]